MDQYEIASKPGSVQPLARTIRSQAAPTAFRPIRKRTIDGRSPRARFAHLVTAARPTIRARAADRAIAFIARQRDGSDAPCQLASRVNRRGGSATRWKAGSLRLPTEQTTRPQREFAQERQVLAVIERLPTTLRW